MNTKTKTINGLAFEISVPYEAGHIVTEAEAKALNQTRAENIGNNLRKKITEMQEAGEPFETIAALVAEADANYIFTLANVSTARKLDPYEKEAVKIARELIKEHLAASGKKLTVAPEGYTQEEWEDKIEGEVERISTSEAVMKAAKKNVDARKKTAESLVESIGGVAV